VQRTSRNSRALRPRLRRGYRGERFHRICNCGHRWVEQAKEPLPEVLAKWLR